MFLRLPHELGTLFEDWLNQYFPLKAKHVMSLIQQSRSGKNYQSAFGKRMRGEGVFADLLATRFKLACKKYKLTGEKLNLNTELFHAPIDWRLDHSKQRGLFE